MSIAARMKIAGTPVMKQSQVRGLRSRPRAALITVLQSSLLVALAALLTTSFQGTARGDDVQTKAIRRSHEVQKTEAQESLGKGDLYALAVGVSDYSNPTVPKLHLSARDAKDFAQFIETQRKVFKNVHVSTLTDREATKQAVEKYLYGDLRKAGKDDSVVLFFSGHGASDPGEPGSFYFLTYDSDPKYLPATAVSMAGLKFLDRMDSKRVVLIVDACHAGGASKIMTKSLESPLDKFMNMFKEASGRVILSSSKPDEYSQEKPNLPNSVFTYYLLKGLKGEADIQRTGVITLQNIYNYVYDRTKEETDGAQHPQMEGAVSGKFPISVLEKLDEPLKLDVWFVAQDSRCANPNCLNPPEGVEECKDPLCGDVTITNGFEMHSQQNYQIGFRPHATSYVYVYQIDTHGNVARLFPGTEFLTPENKLENPLRGGRIYWIPAKDAWARLDNTEGKEKIYVVASRSRNAVLEDLEKEAKDIKQQGADQDAAHRVGQQTRGQLDEIMGISKAIVRKAKPIAGDRKTRSFEELSHAIESTQLDVAQSVWFWHKGRQH